MEAAVFTAGSQKIHVFGMCETMEGTEFFENMEAGVKSDIDKIRDNIAADYRTKLEISEHAVPAEFNRRVE